MDGYGWDGRLGRDVECVSVENIGAKGGVVERGEDYKLTFDFRTSQYAPPAVLVGLVNACDWPDPFLAVATSKVKPGAAK